MFTWKKFLLITAAAAVVGIASAFGWSYYQAGNFNDAAAQSVNTEAPDIAATSLDGTQVKLSDLRGKTVFVNFWATWCGPCMQEMPEINKLYPEYEGKRKAASPSQCTSVIKTHSSALMACRASPPRTLLISTAPLKTPTSAA